MVLRFKRPGIQDCAHLAGARAAVVLWATDDADGEPDFYRGHYVRLAFM